jgi:hypothetical protein
MDSALPPAPALTADELAPRLAALRHRVDGAVLLPGDPGFREAALAWNRGATHDPAVIVVAEDVGDVIAAVTFAADTGLGLGVQATGHGVALPVNGVLLVTARMTGIEVDPEERTAWIEAGCRWGEVLAATQEHGLAPLLGSSPEVGAVGYTLGGGLGWLARKYGPACDAVRSFEVVLPSGELVYASRDEHTELFHALAGGGGGSVGVVTEMEVQLYPVTTVYGGDLTYPAEAAAEILSAWSAWVAHAPDELTSSVVLMNGLRGRATTVVRGCWCGDPDEGRRLLDAWRRAHPPLVDGWDVVPLADLASLSNDPTAPTWRLITGGWLAIAPGATIPHEVGAVLAAATFGAPGDGATPPVLRYCEVRQGGGAISRSPHRGDTSMGNRDGAFLLHLVGVADEHHGPDEIARHLDATRASLGSHLSPRSYLNVLDGPARAAAAHAAIDSDDLARIVRVRTAVDRENVLRYGVDHLRCRGTQ